MFKSKNILLRNVEKVAKAMNWEDDPMIFTGSGYYFTWTNKTEEDVKAIKEKTGIDCKLASNDTLLVPEYNEFKSEKAKDLLLKLSQYGNVMMYLDLCKKSKPQDLKVICKELFNLVKEKSLNTELTNTIKDINEFCKTNKLDDVKDLCRQLFRTIKNNYSDDEFTDIMEDLINKIS